MGSSYIILVKISFFISLWPLFDKFYINIRVFVEAASNNLKRSSQEVKDGTTKFKNAWEATRISFYILNRTPTLLL